MNNDFLIGSWRLKDFKVFDEHGLEKKWQDEIKGLLIYTKDGYMSASINGNIQNEFYTGKYKVIENTVAHYVELASDHEKINNKLERHITMISNNEMQLTARSFCPGSVSKVFWEKIID